MADLSCPRCGERNEPERLYCWVCSQEFGAVPSPRDEKTPARATTAAAPKDAPSHGLWYYVFVAPAGFLGIAIILMVSLAGILLYFAQNRLDLAFVGPAAILSVLVALGAFYLSSREKTATEKILRSLASVVIGLVIIVGVVGILFTFTCFFRIGPATHGW